MGNKPFLLKPVPKNYLWGGNRLSADYGKANSEDHLAESWECSTHPDGQSSVAETGELLGELLKRHPEYLGSHPLQATDGEPVLPILVKLIDAKSDLSIQVHPDDEYAKEHENSLGKTEMWYVLDSEKDAEIVYGFRQDMDQERVRSALQEGRIGRFLNHVPVQKDDVFYIEAGTVHAIGAGVVIAEIQESSNVTYRMYDYDRIDSNGKQRPLHIEKALQVMRYESSAIPRQPMRVLRYRNGSASELLSRCRYFQVERVLLNTEQGKEASFKTKSNSFHVLLCSEGSGKIFGEGIAISFNKGDCIFVPADSIPLKVQGKAQLLNVSC